MKEATAERIAYARRFVELMEKEIQPFVKQVENGPFVRAILKGTFPLEGIQFTHTNHYHLIVNDAANLNLYVAKARNEREMEFFHFMAAEEMNHLNSLFLLTEALGIKRDDLISSQPYSGCLFRTNFFSRLALYGTPGEIALGILLNFPVWAAGARQESKGLKRHYGLGKVVRGTDMTDTDILDRFEDATTGFKERALEIMARDLDGNEARAKMKLVGRWAVETETMVWGNYYAEGVKRGKPRRPLEQASRRGVRG